MSIPDHKLERYRLGELPEAELRALEASLTDADRARLEELDVDDAAILRRLPPRVVAIEVERRAAAQTRRRWMPLLVGGASLTAVAAAALLVLNLPGPPDTAGLGTGVQDHQGVRIKGDARLLVHRQGASGEVRLDDGAPATSGDVLQLELAAGAADHAVIVSVDGNGVVTRHLPLDGAEAVAVEPGRTVALPSAYRLDDAPDFERFFLVTGRGAFGVLEVEEAARALAGRPDAADAPLALPATLEVDDLLIRKEGR